MVHSPNEANPKKRFKVVICGVPGIGKTTLALSAPGTVLVDIDGGWDRVAVQHRKAVAYIQCASYDELLSDMGSKTVAESETIAIDTGGALLNLMKSWAIKSNPTNGQKDGVTLSQRGYGAVGAEFMRFCDMIYLQLGKHLVVTFHAKEDADAEQKVYRLDVEGQTRSNIWKPMDLGGFMEAVRDKRVIGFSPTDRYFAKGTHGITGLMEIPNVANGSPNDFLTTLFARVNQNIAEEATVRKQYDTLMAEIGNLIDSVTTAELANTAVEKMGKMQYVFGAKTQAWHMLVTRAEAIGCKYDPQSKEFVAMPKAPGKEQPNLPGVPAGAPA